jgi:CRISPR-associated protein Cmr5
MKNLAQIRAASALAFALSNVDKGGKEGGEAIKKIPPMIMTNGLLASIAFSIERKQQGLQRPGYSAIFDAISKHLASEDINILSCNGAANLLQKLTETDSQTLKLATAEAMEWLAYARRFVTPE